MGYISTWMGDSLSALLMSLMALQLAPIDQNPFQSCFTMLLRVLDQFGTCRPNDKSQPNFSQDFEILCESDLWSLYLEC